LSSSRSNLPREFAEAFAQARDRLDGLASTILFFPTIGSTNDVALKLAADDAHHGAIVIADEQTAGRGRRGRTWFSPPRSGLYVSTVLCPARAHDAERATALVTLMAGVALAEGIETATGLTADIKWPNDIYVGRRKLAGILAETGGAASSSVVLGYGINIAAAIYPDDVAARATSIESELGRPIDRARLCVETVAAVARRYAELVDGRFDAILDAWRARAPANRGARVVWQSPSGPRRGVTAGIDDRGALLVEAGDSVERIVSGELTWL
jgi:BirA family biotin operon repressor/biotin-[acetyl-CoA-carboxylase] ligase